MTTFRKLCIGLAVTLTFIGSQAPHVLAKSEPSTEAEAPDQSREFSTESGEIVLKGQALMARDQYEAAVNTLSESLTLGGLNPYEQSIIYQMQGSCFYELDQYADAITAFENAVSAGGLLETQRRALELNIAQLLIASDQFEKGAVLIEKWHRGGGQLKKAHIEMLWQAWSQAGRYDRALPWAEQWFNAANPKTRKHFDTLNFFYFNLGMPEKQIDIIEQMVEKWPDDERLAAALTSISADKVAAQ
jgi:tetratricopeptide (TPR) repeat protein